MIATDAWPGWAPPADAHRKGSLGEYLHNRQIAGVPCGCGAWDGFEVKP